MEEGEYPIAKHSVRAPSSGTTWVNPLDKPGPSKSNGLPPRPGVVGPSLGKVPLSPAKPMSIPRTSRRSPSPSTSSSQNGRHRPEKRSDERRSRSPRYEARAGKSGGQERSSRYEDDQWRPAREPSGGRSREHSGHGYENRERNQNHARMDQYVPSYDDQDGYHSRQRPGRYDYDDRGDRRHEDRDRDRSRGDPDSHYRNGSYDRDRGRHYSGSGRYEEDYSRNRRRSRSRSRSRSRDRKRHRTRSPDQAAAEEGEISEDEGSSQAKSFTAITIPEPIPSYQPIKIKNRPTKRISDMNILNPDPPASASPILESTHVTNGHRRSPSPSIPPPPPPDHPPTPPGISTPPPPSERPPTPPPPPPPVNDIKRTTTTPKGPSSSYQPRVPVNKVSDATKAQGRYDAHGDRADGETSVPHAPNRNLQNPPTRPTTPAGKAEIVTSHESRSKLFARPTADEEMRDLHKSFVGTTTLAAYDLGDKLGEGTFGVVTKGIEIATKRHIALKKLITHNARDGVSVTTVREIKILKALNHPNIVEIIDMVVERANPADRTRRGEVFMVFPYMDHDLCGLLSNNDFKLNHSTSKLFMRQILQGMDYIHANNFIHRDIKTANILVDRRGEIKIADFGLARTWTFDELMPKHLATEYTNMVVTRWYRAPELLLGDRHYGPAVDMWSLGCVLGELYNRIPILQGESDRDQLFKIFGKVNRPSEVTFPGWDKLPGFPESIGYAWDKVPEDQPLLDTARSWQMDRGGADLMMQLLRLDPVKRLTAHEALDHPWFWVSPLPAVCANDLISVESSHEMTQKIKNEPRRPVQQPMPGLRVRNHQPQHQQHPHGQQQYQQQQQNQWNGHRPMPHAQPQMGMHGQPMNPYASAVSNPYGGPPRNQFQNGMPHSNGHAQAHAPGPGGHMAHQPHPHQNGYQPRPPNMGMGALPPAASGLPPGLPVRTGGGSYVPPPPFKLSGAAQGRNQNYVPRPPFQLAGHARPLQNGGGPPKGPASMDDGLDAGRKRDQGLPY